MARSPDDGERQEICEAIFAGRKIEAIKLYRELTGVGLKDAKDFVTGLEARLREEQPERFKTPAAAGGCGAVLVVILGIAALVAVWWLVR